MFVKIRINYRDPFLKGCKTYRIIETEGKNICCQEKTRIKQIFKFYNMKMKKWMKEYNKEDFYND